MSTTTTHIATVSFNRVEVRDDIGGDATYVECCLTDPPIEFAVGRGASISEAFADMRAVVLDTAFSSVRLLYDDPEEWKRRAGGQHDQHGAGS